MALPSDANTSSDDPPDSGLAVAGELAGELGGSASAAMRSSAGARRGAWAWLALASAAVVVSGGVLVAGSGAARDQALEPAAKQAAPPALLSGGEAAPRTGNRYDAASGWSLPDRAVARRRGDITRALVQLNRALRAHDRKAFAAVAKPLIPGFGDRQARTFDALGWLPAPPTYTWQGEWAPATVPQGRYRRPCVIAAVTRVYRLPGWDRAPVAEQLALTFLFDGESWVLVSDTDADADPETRASGARNRHEPWNDGPVRTASTRHVLVIGRGFSAGRLTRLARRTESAVREVAGAWPGSAWNGRAVVYAVNDRAFLEGWFGLDQEGPGRDAPTPGERDLPAEFEALVEDVPGAAGPGSGGVAAGVRLIVSPDLVSTSDAGHARAVLRHEIGHLATWTGGGTSLPVWLSEGIAEYLAWRVTDHSGRVDPIAALERRGLPGPMWTALRGESYRPTLPVAARDFYRGSDAEVARHYADAWLVVSYLAHARGEPALRRFAEEAHRASGATGPVPGDPEAGFAAALAHTYEGMGEARLRAEAGAFAQKVRSSFP